MNKKKNKEPKFKMFGFVAFILLILCYLFIFPKGLAGLAFIFGGTTISINIFLCILFLIILVLVFLSFKYSNTLDKIFSILSIILLIMTIFLFIPKSPPLPVSPLDIIQEKLNIAPEQPGTLLNTRPMNFSIDDLQYIAAATVVKNTGLAKDQLVFSTNAYNNDFKVDDDCSSRIEIVSKDAVEYKLCVLCGDTKTDLEEHINDYNLTNVNLNNFCGEDNARTCIVFPEK